MWDKLYGHHLIYVAEGVAEDMYSAYCPESQALSSVNNLKTLHRQRMAPVLLASAAYQQRTNTQNKYKLYALSTNGIFQTQGYLYGPL